MVRSGTYPRLVPLAASLIAIAVLYFGRTVLLPFVVAMLVSFLLAPLVLRLQRWHFPRVLAVVSAMLLVFLACGAASWFAVGEAREVATQISTYQASIQLKVADLRVAVTKPLTAAKRLLRDLDGEPAASGASVEAIVPSVQREEPKRGLFAEVRDLLRPTLDILISAAISLLLAIVMLLRRDDLGDRCMRMVGQGQILVTTRALEEAARKVSRYLWQLLFLNATHGLAVGIGLACLGVPHAVLWGILAAVLRFLPYFGPWIAAVLPFLISVAVSPNWSQPLLVIALFALLELISNNVLEPWLNSSGTGISPLASLVAALFWAWLWGPVGLVLSMPLTVCLVVMAKYVPQLRFLHSMLGDAPGLSPPARLYQRLIAGDQDQAWLVLRTEAEHKPLHELYDNVVLPALSMAELDRQRGALDESTEARLEETMKLLIREAGDLRSASEAGSDPHAANRTLRVLCLPARGSADAFAADMLRQVLERDGVTVEVSSTAELSGETLDLIESRGVDIVCISAVPPSRFMHVRYLCKRIAGRFPKLPLVAGMWTVDLGNQEVVDRLPILDGVHVVATLGAACQQVRRLSESVRLRREPIPAVELSAG